MAVAVSNVGQPNCGVTATVSTSSGGTMTDKNKSVTRLLQHSILQLCNEHIGYSHKLQILGVLCMTVDDEQHELVVKVNNTLKRVNPAPPPQKDIAPAPAPAPPSLSPIPLRIQPDSVQSTADNSINVSGVNSSINSAETGSPSPASSTPSGSGRRSHGRKGANPVKVHHVYDEGELIPEEGSEITTVIPTDPEAEGEAEGEAEEDGAEEEADRSSPAPGPGPVTSTPISLASSHARSSPTQRLLSGGDVKVTGSAKRKAQHQYRSSPLTVVDGEEKSESAPQPQTVSLVSSSAVRALLMGPSRGLTTNGPIISAQSLGSTISLSGVPITPICVAPEPDTPENISAATNGMETSTEDSGLEGSQLKESENRMYIEMNENIIRVKEEPDDDYQFQTSTTDTTADTSGEYSGPSLLPAISADSLPSQVPYSGLVLPIGTSVGKISDGLTIRYTSTGPITVTANGKDASAASNIKDILLYDDRMPVHMQKGTKIETTDYMVDKLGLEGRKRRRRGPEDSLTAEEIAEYMGCADSSNGVFKCSCCVEELHTVTSYLQHTVMVHSAYICHQCGKCFTTKSSLLRHRPIHTGMRRFACSICKKTFYRKDKCKAHIKRHLGSNSNSSTVEQYQQIDPIE